MMTGKLFASTAAVALWLVVALSLPISSRAASNAPAASPECKVALRMITSPGYVRDHVGEIPDAETMTDDAKATFIADLFRKSLAGIDKPEILDQALEAVHTFKPHSEADTTRILDRTRDEIHAQVCRDGWSEEAGRWREKDRAREGGREGGKE